jgi:CRP-like cAMP-binding protein
MRYLRILQSCTKKIIILSPKHFLEMNTLSWIWLFANLTDMELDNLAMFCQERHLKAWEELFLEWDEATAMYVVKGGKMKVYRVRSEWESVLGYIEKNEFVW